MMTTPTIPNGQLPPAIGNEKSTAPATDPAADPAAAEGSRQPAVIFGYFVAGYRNRTTAACRKEIADYCERHYPPGIPIALYSDRWDSTKLATDPRHRPGFMEMFAEAAITQPRPLVVVTATTADLGHHVHLSGLLVDEAMPADFRLAIADLDYQFQPLSEKEKALSRYARSFGLPRTDTKPKEGTYTLRRKQKKKKAARGKKTTRKTARKKSTKRAKGKRTNQRSSSE